MGPKETYRNRRQQREQSDRQNVFSAPTLFPLLSPVQNELNKAGSGMRSQLWFVFVGLLAVVSGAVKVAAVERPPNVVFFLVDDLGATDIGCFGSSFYETPNIDWLAAGGMRFTAAYSACPVCSPTRASVMTGRYPQRTGITDFIGAKQPAQWDRNTRLLPAPYSSRLALEEQTIAETLRDAGYKTFFAGKWHLGDAGFLPTDQGFDVNKGGARRGSPKSYFSPYGNAQLPDGSDGESLTLRLAEETCQFIEANRDRPFFAYLSCYAVHIPLQAPEKLIEKYKAKAAGLKHTGPADGHEGQSKVRLVQDHPTYAAMVEEMDTAVGMVLDKLEELDLVTNTIVVFTADNGGLATAEGRPTSNVPLRAGKGWMYEGGIRVPTIIRWPDVVKAGGESDTPISSIDYFPTLVEATGAAAKAKGRIDGVSLMPLLRREELADRALYWDYPHYGNQGGAPGSAVREGKWKLIEWREDGKLELYDLEADPSEKNDLSEAQPEITKRLYAKLVEWREEVGAKTPQPNPRFEARDPK
jgi:arylsulfatase A-like enzyme